jgi:IS605 OrfB family transposase
VDTNADHLAAWRLDEHGNPLGDPRRFGYDLTGSAQHRDAQVRHALIRLLHWAERHRLAIAVEDLDFQAETTREKHGRRKRFRRLISGMPVSRLRARLVSMAAELGLTIVAVDPAYTSRWGPALAATPHHPPAPRHRPSGGGGGDRTTRPGAPDPATDGTAPARPERSCGASDRPGRTGDPRACGTPPPHPRTTDTIRTARLRSERREPGRPTPFGASG